MFRVQEQLEAQGWKVLRVSNDEVLGDVEAVTIAIARQIFSLPVSPHPGPLPQDIDGHRS
jgi:very-short-patch-repair endonuclease